MKMELQHTKLDGMQQGSFKTEFHNDANIKKQRSFQFKIMM